MTKADFIVRTQKIDNHAFGMLKVFFLIFEPAVAWDKIARAKRGFVFILATHLLPLVLLATALEGWGLKEWGKWQPYYGKVRDFSLPTIVKFEILQAGLLLAVVIGSAGLVHLASQNFHGRRTYLQTFTTIAYAFSPFLYLHVLNAWPAVHPGYPWGIGILLTVWVLYQGVPRVLAPDPTHAFGVYFSAVFIVVLTSGIVRLMTGMFLMGRINFNHSAFTRALGHWLGQ